MVHIKWTPPPPAFAKAPVGLPAGAFFAQAARRSFSEGGAIISPNIRQAYHAKPSISEIRPGHFFYEGGSLKYVYLLQSHTYPTKPYIGLTSDLKKRLSAHNAGQSPHTAKFRPWILVGYLAFNDASKAAAFEKYLKPGSGHAFAEKRLWPG